LYIARRRKIAAVGVRYPAKAAAGWGKRRVERYSPRNLPTI
jgi:hypothetical protein